MVQVAREDGRGGSAIVAVADHSEAAPLIAIEGVGKVFESRRRPAESAESRTVTVKLLLPVLPLTSVAVQVTLVGPNGNGVPLAGVQTVGRAPLRLSRADAVNVTVAPATGVPSLAREGRL